MPPNAGGRGRARREPLHDAPGNERRERGLVHRRRGLVVLLPHDDEMGGGIQVPVEREQVGGRVEAQLRGPAGERLDQRASALAPTLVAAQLTEPGTDDSRDPVGRRGRRVLHRLGA
jgi:hypothetical protein